MQKQMPNTRPVAKHVNRQKTNLAKASDQLKIHRNVYQDYLLNSLSLSTRTVDKLIRLYDKLVDAKDMERDFNASMPVFHNDFITKLNNL